MACIYQYRVIQSSFTALEILHALPGHTARLLGQVVLMKYRLCFPLSTILALNLSFAPGPRPFPPHHLVPLSSTVVGTPAGGASSGWGISGLSLGHDMSEVPIDFQVGMSSSSWRLTSGDSERTAGIWSLGTNTS